MKDYDLNDESDCLAFDEYIARGMYKSVGTVGRMMQILVFASIRYEKLCTEYRRLRELDEILPKHSLNALLQMEFWFDNSMKRFEDFFVPLPDFPRLDEAGRRALVEFCHSDLLFGHQARKQYREALAAVRRMSNEAIH